MPDTPENPAAPVHITTSVLTDMIASTAGPIAVDAAQRVANTLVDAVNTTTDQVKADVQATVSQAQTQMQTAVTDLFNDHKAQVSAQITEIANKVVANATSDPVTERYIILAVVGALLLGGLIILVAALLGNGTADHYIGAGFALLAGPLLTILRPSLPVSKALPQAVADKLSN